MLMLTLHGISMDIMVNLQVDTSILAIPCRPFRTFQQGGESNSGGYNGTG